MKMWLHHIINVLTVLIGLLITIGYLYTRRQFSFWARKDVQFKKPHFIFGNFGDIVQRKVLFGQVLINLYNGFKGERFGGVWHIFTPQLFVLDPSLLGQILIKDFGTWSSRGMTNNLDVNPLKEHLVSLDGKKWKILRTKLTPTFSSLKLKNMYYLLQECSENFEKHLDSVATKGEPVDVADIAAKFTTDVIGSCVFGIEMNSLNDQDAVFREMGRKIFERTPKKHMVSMIQNGFPWLFKFLKLSAMSQEVSDFFIKITKETLDFREENDIQRHDFMDVLKNLRNSSDSFGEDKVEFNDTFLAAQAFVFFAAGFHSSSSTIACCLHELAVNQDIQDQVREEVHRTIAANDGKITGDVIENMKYLDMVMQETLRKYPVVPMLERMSVRPYRIPYTNVDLPTGMKAIIPIYALHHDPEYYPDPDKFDPQRFTEEAKNRRPAFTYLPFGDGPRSCIGLKFSIQQVKLALVKVVYTFEVSLCEKSQNPLRMDIIGVSLEPERGIWLKISRTVVNEKSTHRL